MLKQTKNLDSMVLQENHLIVGVLHFSHRKGYMGHYIIEYMGQVDHVSYQMICLNRMLGPPGLAIFYPNQINR